MTEKLYAITFPPGPCGIEILFDVITNEFEVGQCHSELAKIYESVLSKSKMLSLNWKRTSKLASMDDMKKLFKAHLNVEKRLIFKKKFTEDDLRDVIRFNDEMENFEILNYNKGEDFHAGQYIIQLGARPLGFTIAPSPTGGVEVVQVDSVHEEDIKLGSKLIAVNGIRVEGSNHAIRTLMTCFVPARIVLEMSDQQNIFAPENKDDEETPTWLALSDNMGDMVELSIHWFDQAIGKKDFILLIKADATVAEIRAKIAVTSQLKFNAVRLIAKRNELKDDQQKLCDLKFNESEKITVVVSHTTQEKEDEKTSTDYLVEMKIIGAFLASCDKSLMRYLWDDIDFDFKSLLHITELDRLLERFMGLYERANCIHIPMEYEHGSVTFSTKEKLGLVIEGNEVIMTRRKSQAERLEIKPGWRVVGAEYMDRAGRMLKFPVDHKSCLDSLKRATDECADSSFRALCLIPKGQRFETLIIMKKQAIADLELNDAKKMSTMTFNDYNKLPQIYAMKAVRVSCKESLEPSSFSSGAEKGAYISKETKNTELMNYIDAHVLSINSTTVAHMPFGDIMKVLLELKPPHFLTVDGAST